ncbi:MAG: hypothetical protein JWN63_371, partial [Candidatus Acidoferrum typicum]|nr:hypothetical protein [Candidatus Acidoferrum typicum]
MIAHDPLHGSGRADFPHPALALGDDAHVAQGIGMTDRRQRQPASDEAPHTIPEYATILAAPRQRAVPEPGPMWVANPLLPYDFCIHYTSPVQPAHRRNEMKIKVTSVYVDDQDKALRFY